MRSELSSRLCGPIGAAAFGLFLMAGPAAAAPSLLAAHQAVYDLSLDVAKSGDSVSDAEGRMVYDFSGSACEGFTTKVRFVTRVSDSDGNARLTDVSTTTFEDSASKTFSFATKSYVDGTVTEDSIGSAERSGAGVKVTLAKPDVKTFKLPQNFEFPNQHMETVLEAALAGRHFVQIDLFDGSEKGEKPYATSAVIGPLNSGADDLGDEATAKSVGIEGLRHWPVTLSYFEKTASGEQSPSYELSFIIYENGIIRRMHLDYGDFALSGKLVKLQLKPTKASTSPCK